MSTTSSTMTTALDGLQAANDSPRPDGPALGNWRWTVRQRMAAVRDALLAETGTAPDDDWLAARGGTSFRERNVLLGRLGDLGSRVLEDSDVAAVHREVSRLVVDVTHHVQRVNDLAYDDVELELGGSE